jgi:hypothetical protein
MEIDTPIFQGQRKQLCEHLFSKGYAKEQVLEAMMSYLFRKWFSSTRLSRQGFSYSGRTNYKPSFHSCLAKRIA